MPSLSGFIHLKQESRKLQTCCDLLWIGRQRFAIAYERFVLAAQQATYRGFSLQLCGVQLLDETESCVSAFSKNGFRSSTDSGSGKKYIAAATNTDGRSGSTFASISSVVSTANDRSRMRLSPTSERLSDCLQLSQAVSFCPSANS